MSSSAPEMFVALLDCARRDPDILAFWLDGSRGKGRPGPHSDFDCSLIVTEARLADYRRRWAETPDGMDLSIMTLGQFADLAAWGSDQSWMRYNFAHLAPLVDKTGQIAPLMAAKARAPAPEVDRFIDRSLDRFVNQVYRAMKCLRDHDPVAARLEGAQAGPPLLDAIFAFDGGRLTPYAKYLSWELLNHPLAASPWDAEDLIAMLPRLLDGEGPAYREAFATVERWFRARGHAAVFDAWGQALAWMSSPDARAA